MQEPSVLDFIKSKIAPWKYPPVAIPVRASESGTVSIDQILQEYDSGMAVVAGSVQARPGAVTEAVVWPWRMLLGIFLALIAQGSFEPLPGRTWTVGLVLYLLAAGLLAWAAWRDEWSPAQPPASKIKADAMLVRAPSMILGLVFAVLTFLTSGSNRFTWINLGFLALSLIFLVHAFWSLSQNDSLEIAQPHKRSGEGRSIKDYGWILLVVGMFCLAIFFRFADLDQVPGEMNSDHAEKIYDVLRVLDGQASIFFPNNGGREGLQIYLVAGLQKLFDLEPGFMPLKIVSATAGFLTLPFIYLLGKEVASRRAGLIAAAFAGVAYWPNVISRLGLRLPFYSLFTAATLYFYLRGLRTGRRNDFILAGLVLGLSLYGYSADRILPLLLCAALAVFLLHPASRGQRARITLFTILAIVLAGVVFLPLMRYMLDEPQVFLYRSLTRVSGVETPLSAPAWLIFLANTGRALAMYFWSNGEIWTASIANRPALDIVSGALFASGIMLLLTAYLRKQTWQHVFLLISIPLLMLPSIMSLAFPFENPNLYRTAGALIPVFLVVGIALDALMTSLQASPGFIRKSVAWGAAALLLIVSSVQSFNLVFDRYRHQYEQLAWNSSEMGQVVHSFAGTFDNINHIWLMGYPYWVDARLVAINAGHPERDLALSVDRLGEVASSNSPQLFLIKPEDQSAIAALYQHFPGGQLRTYFSKIPSKDFLVFIVPAN